MLKTINMKLTRTFYIAAALWVVVGSAIGIYIYDQWARQDEKEALAPLASTRTCGQERILSDKDVAEQASKWLVNQSATPTDLQKVMLRNLTALPETATKALRQIGIRFAVETGQTPYACAGQNTTTATEGISCVKSTPKDGLFAVLSNPQRLSSDGSPLNAPPSEQLEPIVLPISFWILFQGVWRTEKPKPPLDDEISPSNRLLTIKKYLVSAYKFSPGEVDYYHKYYSASGTQSPTFLTRSLILTASDIYCSKTAYENLSSQEPEAVQRFWQVYGCTLGKPWHMTDDNYQKICTEKPPASSTGAKP